MRSRWDTVRVHDGEMRVYLGLPELGSPRPGVVVIQHAGGVSDYIQETVDRLADAGYVAAAPDLYHRQSDSILEEVARLPAGHPDRVPMTLSKAGKLQDDDVLADVAATMEYVRSLSDVQVARLGIMGFCMGGRVAYLVPTRSQAFDACAIFYGAGITTARGDGPAALDGTNRINCPIIGFFGEDDRNPSPEHVQAISEVLGKHDKPFEFHSYPGAGHAFMEVSNPTLPGVYREAAAKDAWARLLRFFEEHLMSPREAAQHS